MTWVRSHLQLLAWLSLVAMTSFGFYLIVDGRHDACVARNRANRDTAVVVANAIVENAKNVTPEQVDAFLASIDREAAKVQVDC